MTQTDTKTWNLAKIDEISKFMMKFQNLIEILVENEEIFKFRQKWQNCINVAVGSIMKWCFPGFGFLVSKGTKSRVRVVVWSMGMSQNDEISDWKWSFILPKMKKFQNLTQIEEILKFQIW